MRSATAVLLASLTAVACAGTGDPAEPHDAAAPASALDPIAASYVRLVLALGEHDDGYVDAYYGPEEWRAEALAMHLTLEEIERRATQLLAGLDGLPAVDGAAGDGELGELRRRFLARQLEALVARVDLLQGETMSFDEESQALYDAATPHLGEEHFAPAVAELDRRLAAAGHRTGTLGERLAAYRADFVVPPERLAEAFALAIAACRERTLRHLELPAGESFEVEYVSGRPWSAYNWYQGDYRSLIQVNTELPTHVDRLLHLACHEGYPGHHVFNALLEERLVVARGWRELTVYPLYSPQSLLAEGTADYGLELAFPGAERVAFERDVLYPAAGLDASRAAEYREVMDLVERLAYADNQAARRYLDGEVDAAATRDWLVRHAAMAPERAEQRLRFFDAYRGYVINYTLGEDLVRDYVERRAGDDLAARWAVFESLLTQPRLPSDLADAR